jgi:hypothetical protein
MGALFGGGGGGGPPPPQQTVQVINPPPPDPDLAEQRAQIKMKGDSVAAAEGARSAQDAVARTMGMRGARSLFTGTAAGYRTLGGANV